jgi:hypothetical protein
MRANAADGRMQGSRTGVLLVRAAVQRLGAEPQRSDGSLPTNEDPNGKVGLARRPACGGTGQVGAAGEPGEQLTECVLYPVPVEIAPTLNTCHQVEQRRGRHWTQPADPVEVGRPRQFDELPGQPVRYVLRRSHPRDLPHLDEHVVNGT